MGTIDLKIAVVVEQDSNGNIIARKVAQVVLAEGIDKAIGEYIHPSALLGHISYSTRKQFSLSFKRVDGTF